jgi:hypothetical protein
VVGADREPVVDVDDEERLGAQGGGRHGQQREGEPDRQQSPNRRCEIALAHASPLPRKPSPLYRALRDPLRQPSEVERARPRSEAQPSEEKRSRRDFV